MSKQKLADQIKTDGMPDKKPKEIVDVVLKSIIDGLQLGTKVTIKDFGTFSVKEYAERKGRNPQTGEEITIPAGKRIKFKPAKTLSEKI
ncbi:MAG: HU family DNA-binding protein [Desulfovermiculus sp.]